MDKNRISEWCEKLVISKEYPLKKDEMSAVWNPVKEKLTIDEQNRLLVCLVQNSSVFRWLHLINYLLPDLFSDSEHFANLVELVVDKIKNDMAQGSFIRSLIAIGEKDPNTAIKFYSRLCAGSNDVTIHYSGLVLGGAAKKKFDETYEVIQKGINEGKTPVKVACLKALRVAFEVNSEVKFHSEILGLVEQMSKIRDPAIQSEVINAYIDFDRFAPERCEQRLIDIATGGDSAARSAISNRLWLTDLADQRKVIDLLRICAADKDSVVLANVARALSRKGQAFLKDALEITKAILMEYKEYDRSMMDYYISELCKNDAETCLATFEEWRKSEKREEFQFRLAELSEKLRMRK